jgi:hypothetical protein
MLDLIKNNKIVLIVAGILIAGAAWYGTRTPSATETAILTGEVVSSAAQESEREAIDSLLRMRAIELSGAIFSDPAFLSLQDFRTEIVQEPVGRRNPFAPFDVSSTTVTATTTRTSPPAPMSPPPASRKAPTE